MMGLAYIVAFAVYLLVSIGVVVKVVRTAKRNNRSPWGWGGAAALVMYLLVFWDHIPTLLMHKYYCEKEAGFWVYKTPEQWIKEHPETIGEPWGWESGVQWSRQKLTNGSRNWLSKKIYYDTYREPDFGHAMVRQEKRLIDSTNGEILAKSINFFRGSTGQFANGFRGSSDWKLWLGWGNRECKPRGFDLKTSESYTDLFDENMSHLIQRGAAK